MKGGAGSRPSFAPCWIPFDSLVEIDLDVDEDRKLLLVRVDPHFHDAGAVNHGAVGAMNVGNPVAGAVLDHDRVGAGFDRLAVGFVKTISSGAQYECFSFEVPSVSIHVTPRSRISPVVWS